MRKIIAIAAISALGLASSAYAQDEGGEGTDTPEAEEAGNGAIVTREEITEQVLDENGEPIPVLDENGDPVLDDDGNPVYETVVVGFTQTVETPSGITHTVSKEDGSPAVVTHTNLGAPDAAAQARESAAAAASTARQTADAARQNAASAREQAQQAREAAQNARDNARNIPRPGRPG
jgi:hypothetical protein